MSSYTFRSIEKKWQERWSSLESFRASDQSTKPKAYILEMLPYPSGYIHMGHVRNYTIGDALARYKRALGYEVLHPIGWDAFGLPAENAAIDNNIPPPKWVKKNIAHMKQQLKSLGFSYDWTREINTSDPRYYGQEQKIFLSFYQRGVAFRKESWVNWDPVENSVLANEQVVNGRGWRSGAPVEKRKLNQWSLRITDYAQSLLDDLKHLTGWPEKVVRMQENWIGRSEGAKITFTCTTDDFSFDVFTACPEALFGASFCAIAPTHPLAEKLAASDPALQEFIATCAQMATTEESISTVEKKGYDTKRLINHPLLHETTLPLYVANFVLMDYGTGAIYGCPAHDERDLEFTTLYHLPILPVIHPDNGTLINSQFLDGLTVDTAREKVLEFLEEKGIGARHITYRLRDWCVSRQRYWGCPIPIVHCQTCGVVPVPEKDLPVLLPEDVVFEHGHNPLDTHPTWKHVPCPACQAPATRETDTLDTFFESSWYFLRYCCPQSPQPIDAETIKTWMPVSWYIGGIEHAVLHLLYSRFFTKALRDAGYLNLDEPFANLLTQGMICHRTYQDKAGNWLYPSEVNSLKPEEFVVGRSEKMSKSKKNLVDPVDIIDTFGADTARLFTLSDTPPDRDLEWSEEGLEGCWRYLNRVARLGDAIANYQTSSTDSDASLALRKYTHQMIVRVTQGYERLVFNKVIANARELTKTLEEALESSLSSRESIVECFETLLQILNPMVPHLTSELWQQLHDRDILDATWPQADMDLAAVSQVTIAVQVNGKMRGSFEAVVDSPQETLQEMAMALPNVQRDIEGRSVRRIIIVPNRIVNVVI
ncbi:MAG: leucine--tRNA ligase [Alphaproteobacteria bacterium]